MLTSDELKNILTLRYNPESISSLRKLSWKDFQTKSSHDEAFTIEDLIKKSILKFVVRLIFTDSIYFRRFFNSVMFSF